DVLVHHGGEISAGHGGNMESAHRTAALHQRKDRGLRNIATAPTSALVLVAIVGLPADIGFINFDGRAVAAERGHAAVFHGFADTHAHKPRSFHPDAQGALKLAGANPLLARNHHVNGLQPKMHRRVAILEDGADLDGKGLLALVALTQPDPGGFALQTANAFLIEITAMGTGRPFRPKPRLYVGVGGVFIVETGVGKNGCHRLNSLWQQDYTRCPSMSSETFPFVL